MKVKDLQALIQELLEATENADEETEIEFSFGNSENQKFMRLMSAGVACVTNRKTNVSSDIIYFEFLPNDLAVKASVLEGLKDKVDEMLKNIEGKPDLGNMEVEGNA